MINQTEKIGEYLRLTKEIDKLTRELGGKESAAKSKYSADYGKIKRELSGYIAKIKPTVETVCSLYRSKAQISGGKVYLSDGAPRQGFNAFNACEVAIKLGNEAIKLLSAVIQKVNVDVNLREFAVRYNTIIEIYSNADKLEAMAVNEAMASYKNEIAALNLKKQQLFRDANEFNALVKQVKANSARLYERAVINDTMTLQTEFVTEISLPMAYEVISNAALGGNNNDGVILSCLDWSLHKDGIAVIKADGRDIDRNELSTVAVNTVMQFLFAYPQLNKRILICDSCSSNTITTFAGILKNGNTELFFDGANGSYVKNSDEEIRASLSELNRIINQRIMILGQSRCADALEYNKKNQDNPLPIILTVLNGYPFKYENAVDDVASVLKNGKAAGVYFLIVENTYDDEDSRYYRKRLPSTDSLTRNVAEFKTVNGNCYLVKDQKAYFANTCGKNYSISSVLSVFKVSVKNNEGKIVYLDGVVPKEDFASSSRRKKYSKTLSIPFGKQGSEPVSIELNASGADAHLALIGTTGSGKTAFINSLVLSACKLYSPEELELHLIVMVKGDFRIFEEQKLPHLKTVVTGDRIFAANDILDFIDEEMKTRSELIGSYGNIYAYNEAATKKLPRCVIVIDEFYQLVQGSDDAVSRIEKIAQTGRAYGISLVISSIKFPIEVNSIIPLFGNRIEFKSGENAGQLIPQASLRQGELESAKGLCFFSNSGNVKNVRVAYSEEGDKLKAHIAEVRGKYPSRKMELRSEIKALRVEREQDVPFAVKKAKANYDEEGIIRTRLGRTYLSSKALEYPFDSKNNLLFLFGHYLETKNMEASLIKDTFVLSKDIDEPTVYYIDYNRNASLRRAKNTLKSLRDGWVLSNKMVYATSDEAEDTIGEIKDLISTRENDEESEIYPVLVIIAKADDMLNDDDMRDELFEVIAKGKENNVYFVIQCSEPVSFYGSDKYVNDAIIFPDRYSEDDEYTSTALCSALEAMPAGATDKGRKLIYNASLSPLDPKLHILCDNNKLTIFIPYEYDEEYLKNIVD